MLLSLLGLKTLKLLGGLPPDVLMPSVSEAASLCFCIFFLAPPGALAPLAPFVSNFPVRYFFRQHDSMKR